MDPEDLSAHFLPIIEKSKTLLTEFADTLDLAETNRSLGFRSAIMHIFSYMEAMCFLLKRTVTVNCSEGRWKDRIPIQTYLASLDEVYDIADNGNATTRPKKVPMRGHVLFCLRFVAAYRRVSFDPTKVRNWSAFDPALKVRHRLTHPKRISDLDIADKEYAGCVDALEWFVSCLQEVTGCEHRYPKQNPLQSEKRPEPKKN